MQVNKNFCDEEELYRAIYNPPRFTYLTDKGYFSSSVFKDYNGMGLSVDRSDMREQTKVIDAFINRKSVEDYLMFAVIDVGLCKFSESETLQPAIIVYSPRPETCEEPENIFHSEIYKSYDDDIEARTTLSKKQARYLARRARRIDLD